MANTYLSRTTSTAGNGQKFTFSAWVKRSLVGSGDPSLFCCGAGNSSQADQFFFGWNDGGASRDKLSIQQYNGTPALRTNRRFRDVNAWYHIVLAVDTTQATDTNRLKLYVNGVQETSFADTNYPTQNYSYAFGLGTSKVFVVGAAYFSSYGRFFDGSMSHVHYIDGTAYDASAFGSTDSTTGEWKINTSPSVTYGTNGFFILKDGNSGTDQSGQSNTFSISGTLTKTEDNPSNVFATLNPLLSVISYPVTFANGNLTTSSQNATGRFQAISTLGASSGKYYAEFKLDSGTTYHTIGVATEDSISSASPLQSSNNYIGQSSSLSYGYYGADGDVWSNGSIISGFGSTTSVGDIIGVAMDLDNNYLYFSVNGTFQNSGDPTSGATGTGGVSIPSDKIYFFAVGDLATGSFNGTTCNFGSPAFTISSGNSDGNSKGNFEYAVPSGYFALCTSNLAEHG